MEQRLSTQADMWWGAGAADHRLQTHPAGNVWWEGTAAQATSPRCGSRLGIIVCQSFARPCRCFSMLSGRVALVTGGSRGELRRLWPAAAAPCDDQAARLTAGPPRRQAGLPQLLPPPPPLPPPGGSQSPPAGAWSVLAVPMHCPLPRRYRGGGRPTVFQGGRQRGHCGCIGGAGAQAGGGNRSGQGPWPGACMLALFAACSVKPLPLRAIDAR